MNFHLRFYILKRVSHRASVVVPFRLFYLSIFHINFFYLSSLSKHFYTIFSFIFFYFNHFIIFLPILTFIIFIIHRYGLLTSDYQYRLGYSYSIIYFYKLSAYSLQYKPEHTPHPIFTPQLQHHNNQMISSRQSSDCQRDQPPYKDTIIFDATDPSGQHFSKDWKVKVFIFAIL